MGGSVNRRGMRACGPGGQHPSGAAHPRSARLSLAVSAALTTGVPFLPVMTHAADENAAAPEGALQEITVTARKRTENLQDVPISMDVFSSKDLQNLAITKFEDYATLTPSLAFISAGPGTQTLVMRGVSDGSNPNYGNASLSLFMVDDMSMSFYGVTPDLHLYDIERIEVLNGPQGTTFGAGSMGGAVRFITNKPDPTAFSAGVDLDAGKIDGGTRNSVVEAYLNLPVVPDWTAVRLSVYDDYRGGFITNALTTRHWVNGTTSTNAPWAGKDYNHEKIEGGRLAISQKIAEGWKATATASYQSQLAHGAWDEDPSIGGARSLDGTLVNGPVRPEPPNTVARFGPEFKQYYTKTFDFHLDGDLGIADLVYANTWWAQDDRWVNEYSEYMQYANVSPTFNATTQQAFACLTDPINGAGFSGCNVPTLYYDYRFKVTRWSNELRLQSKSGGWFHWLIGGYWEKTHEAWADYYHMPGLQTAGEQYKSYVSYYGATTPPPGPDDWFSYNARFDYLQSTEFTNEVIDILPTLHLELGTVHFSSHQSTDKYGGYWYRPQQPNTVYGSSNRWNSKADLSYNVSKDVLVYADVAQGFRDGGPNLLPSNCTPPSGGAPNKFEPDSLTNYELGWKTTWLEGRLVWNGAFYYMPWHGLQNSVFDPAICTYGSFTTNIGDAQVYGTESEIKFRPNSHWNFDFMASYNDARVRTDNYYNSSFQVTPGERLPYDPYFNWSGQVRYETPVQDTLHGYAQYDAEHKGDMWNDIQANGYVGLPRVLQPGYTIMNLRVGVSETASHWLGELYITNLANKNAVIYTNEGNYDLRFTRNEPRVFGVRFSYRWGKPTAAASD